MECQIMNPGEKELIPTGYEAITVNTSIGITAGLLTPVAGTYTGKKAVGAYISIETDQIRYTLDGVTAPTNLIGHLVDTGSSFWLFGPVALANLRMIKVTNNASAKVTVFHVGSRLG
jgi:hypothetical protein